MNQLFAVSLIVFILVLLFKELGPHLMASLRTGAMPGIGRPYSETDTPVRFWLAVTAAIVVFGFVAALAAFVIVMSVRDLLTWGMHGA